MIKKFNDLNKEELKKIKKVIEEEDLFIEDITDIKYTSNGREYMLYTTQKAEFDPEKEIINPVYSTTTYDKFTDINNNYIVYDGYLNNMYLTNTMINGYETSFPKYLTMNKCNIDKPIIYYSNKFLPEKEKVEYELLSYKDMLKFIKNNYILNNNLICHRDGYENKILGLYYTDIKDISNEYFIGYINNKYDKKTIIAVFSIIKDLNFEDNNYTYVKYVETNLFYRNSGIFKDMIQNFKNICPKNNIIISAESPMGKVIGTHNQFKKYLPDRKILNEDNLCKIR